MKNTSSFARLWSYLKVYKFAVAFAIFLKILSVVMSVVEPFVLGLAITELTNNLLDMAKGVAGAQINVSYVGWSWSCILCGRLFMKSVLTILITL